MRLTPSGLYQPLRTHLLPFIHLLLFSSYIMPLLCIFCAFCLECLFPRSSQIQIQVQIQSPQEVVCYLVKWAPSVTTYSSVRVRVDVCHIVVNFYSYLFVYMLSCMCNWSSLMAKTPLFFHLSIFGNMEFYLRHSSHLISLYWPITNQ